MAQCCTNCYKICEPFLSCPAGIFIKTPPSAFETGVYTNIVKPGVNVRVQQSLGIDPNGFVEVIMDELPEGFLNPYGGQYEISFTDLETGNIIEFVAKDGNTYTHICLTFMITYSSFEENNIIINAIDNEVP
jgi:hypothetical protein